MIMAAYLASGLHSSRCEGVDIALCEGGNVYTIGLGEKVNWRHNSNQLALMLL